MRFKAWLATQEGETEGGAQDGARMDSGLSARLQVSPLHYPHFCDRNRIKKLNLRYNT